VNYHIEIGHRRRYGEGAHVAGGMENQIVSVDDLSFGKAICVRTLLRGSCFVMSVTKL
jgi:hypothetical protein